MVFVASLTFLVSLDFLGKSFPKVQIVSTWASVSKSIILRGTTQIVLPWFFQSMPFQFILFAWFCLLSICPSTHTNFSGTLFIPSVNYCSRYYLRCLIVVSWPYPFFFAFVWFGSVYVSVYPLNSQWFFHFILPSNWFFCQDDFTAPLSESHPNTAFILSRFFLCSPSLFTVWILSTIDLLFCVRCLLHTIPVWNRVLWKQGLTLTSLLKLWLTSTSLRLSHPFCKWTRQKQPTQRNDVQISGRGTARWSIPSKNRAGSITGRNFEVKTESNLWKKGERNNWQVKVMYRTRVVGKLCTTHAREKESYLERPGTTANRWGRLITGACRARGGKSWHET